MRGFTIPLGVSRTQFSGDGLLLRSNNLDFSRVPREDREPEVLIHKILSGSSKKFLGGWIGEADMTRSIYNYDSVGHPVDDQPEAMLLGELHGPAISS